MRHHIYFILGLFSIPSLILTQPQIEWVRTYDAGRLDGFNDLYASTDGGYVMAGFRRDRWVSPDSTSDPWIFKVDGEGEPVWSLAFGRVGMEEYATSIIETDAGDYLAVGRAGSQVSAWMVSSEGELRWSQGYLNGIAQAVIELKAGNFVICGEASGGPAFLLSIEDNGDEIWTHTYGAGRFNSFMALRETEGGIVAAGRSYFAEGPPYYRVLIAKTDFNGDPIWIEYLAPQRNQFCFSMVSRPEGGFALGGMFWEGDGNSGYDHMWMAVSPGGQLVSWRRHNIVNRDHTLGISRALPRGYAMVGVDEENGIYIYPRIVRLNEEGGVLWTESYDMQELLENMASSRHTFTSVIVGHDSALVACGYATAANQQNGLTNGLLMRLEPEIINLQFVEWSPPDTTLEVLAGDSLTFFVHVRGPRGMPIGFAWHLREGDADSVVSRADTLTLAFPRMGNFIVECQASLRDITIAIHWSVRVTDFFISDWSPDALGLILRRGFIQEFEVEVATLDSLNPIEGRWHLIDREDGDRDEVIGEGMLRSLVLFDRTGPFGLKVQVWQEERSDSLLWNVQVRGIIRAFWPQNSPLTLTGEGEVEFGVLPFDLRDETLHYWWVVNEDTILQDTTQAAIFFPDTGDYRIWCYVKSLSDSLGEVLDADSQDWEVRVVPPNSAPGIDFPLPSPFSLAIYPNPFNDQAQVLLDLPRPTLLALRIYDIQGRLVGQMEPQLLPAGKHLLPLKGLKQGETLPPGVYLLHLQTPSQGRIVKLALVK